MYQFRKATLSDLDFLMQLEKSNFTEDRRSTKRSLQHSLTSPAQCVWIIEDTVPVGAAILHLFKHAIRIYSIAIDKRFASQGYGTLLLKHCETYSRSLGIYKITLEADSGNESLVNWYKKNGYNVKEFLTDYYSTNHSAFRMFKYVDNISIESGKIQNIIISDTPLPFMEEIPQVEVVTTSEYIQQKRFNTSAQYRVFNCLDSYAYQSKGYYMSLLAAARDHRIIPSVATINDLTDITIATSISYDIQKFVNDEFAHEKGNIIQYPVIFSHNAKGKMTHLSKALYQLFEAPFILFEFIKADRWLLSRTQLLTQDEVSDYTTVKIHGLAKNYFAQKRFNHIRIKNFEYDLAILTNPEEQNPPSNVEALQKFKLAGERHGFYVEFIQKKDIHRINEFDALFIRETTHVANHTYQLSRHAHAEGLVVIDDPWSILKCSNKFYLQERMRKAKIKMPASVILQPGMDFVAEVEALKFPLVIKQPDSAFSLGVHKVKTPEELEATCHAIFETGEFIIAQAYTPTDFDWRIGVLDNQPIFACKYMMASGHWQIYNWQGEASETEGDSVTLPIKDVPAPIIEMAVKAASYIGDGLYGIDIKEINGVPYLIEINDNPNIDAGIEDLVEGDKLYDMVILSLKNRILQARSSNRSIKL